MDSTFKTTSIGTTQHRDVTEQPVSLKENTASMETGDAAQFRAALQRHMPDVAKGSDVPAVQGAAKPSLGEKIMNRANSLAGEIKNDQEYVSRLLEQATRTGDSMQMMKAMMALSDYQTRVQFVSKTVSKATSAIDQLTRMQ